MTKLDTLGQAELDEIKYMAERIHVDDPLSPAGSLAKLILRMALVIEGKPWPNPRARVVKEVIEEGAGTLVQFK